MPGTVDYLKDKLMRAIDTEGNVSCFCDNIIHNCSVISRQCLVFMKVPVRHVVFVLSILVFLLRFLILK